MPRSCLLTMLGHLSPCFLWHSRCFLPNAFCLRVPFTFLAVSDAQLQQGPGNSAAWLKLMPLFVRQPITDALRLPVCNLFDCPLGMQSSLEVRSSPSQAWRAQLDPS